ncbi:MAG: ComEA family DNA-binding protein [Oscillospiraceae bacterium]|nr:ComEA family DNA-binding protein [Oscillospiraceae bacterium]
MKFKFSRKAGIVTFITAVVLFAIGGLILDRVHDNRFTIEKLPEDEQNEISEVKSDSAVNPNPDAEEKTDGKININTASVETLTEIKGIGQKTAEKIVHFREANGDFQSIEEITKVSGIGKSKFEDIKENICVE